MTICLHAWEKCPGRKTAVRCIHCKAIRNVKRGAMRKLLR